MEYSRIAVSQTDALWELQKAYKAEIEEDMPTEQDLNRLKEAIEENRILFYGALALWRNTARRWQHSISFAFPQSQSRTEGFSTCRLMSS